MLVGKLLEFYNGFLYSIIMCYIVYRLNTDLKAVSILKYICNSLVIAMVLFVFNALDTDINYVVRMTAIVLCVIFTIFVFNRYSIYHSTVTAVFGSVLLGFAELFVSLAYVYPLKLTLDKYRSSFVHITVGEILAFLFVYLVLRLIGDSFIKVRKRVHIKYNKFTILLCANLIAVFVVLLFVFSLFSYYFNFAAAGSRSSTLYMSIVIVSAVLIASIIGTIYLINFFILNRIKYEKLKLDNAMDLMTDTLNRVSGLKFLEDQIEHCKNSSDYLTLCYVDVNDLKLINDMLGHREGDQLIKTIAAVIKENIRETDVISRLGGDEFVIIFPGCTMDYAEKVLDRISEKLREIKLFKTDEEYTISISFGFSQYNGEYGTTADILLDKADHQMYLNKRALKSLA